MEFATIPRHGSRIVTYYSDYPEDFTQGVLQMVEKALQRQGIDIEFTNVERGTDASGMEFLRFDITQDSKEI